MSDFHQFEDQLRDSLRRVPPPAGLEQRILARVESRRRFAHRRWLAAAASLVFVFGAGSLGIRYRQQKLEEQRVEQVRQQFTVALRIASKHLSKTDRQLRAIGVQRIDLTETAR